MTKSNYSIAVDAEGRCWGCAPDSEADITVRREADEMMGKALLVPKYVIHSNILLTDEEDGEILCTASEENALIDDDGVAYKFAVRINAPADVSSPSTERQLN